MSKNELEPVTDLGIDRADKERDKKLGKKGKESKKAGKIVIVGTSIFITVICAIGCIYYWSRAVAVSVGAMAEAYGSVKDTKVEEIRQEYREKGFADGGEDYHTSNRITISIDKIYETAELEVMKVSDVVYIIDEDEKDQAWLKATGTGVYIVNLTAGEYLIDSERQYVLVRVPKPELKVNLDNTELIFFNNGGLITNGSIGEGEDLARKQRGEAQIKLLEDIESNQLFYQCAEDSAKTQIESLVRMFNNKIPDLEVDVEFFD